MTQSFMLRSALPIEQTVEIDHVFLKQYFWAGKNSDIQFLIKDPQTQTIFVQQPLQMINMDPRSGVVQADGSRALKLAHPIYLKLNTPYEMVFQMNAADHPFSLYHTNEDYPDGENDQGLDIWFKVLGQANWLDYQAVSITSHTDNALIFDPGWATPQVAKMLNSLGEAESLIINKLQKDLNLRYSLSHPDHVLMQVTPCALQDVITLQGLTPGTRYLNVYHNSQLIQQVALHVTLQHSLSLSFSYIAYPGERDHDNMRSFERIKADFTSVFNPLNIQFNWHDNGVLIFDRDLNQDGASYTPQYDEMMSPMNHNILPNMDQYFSNVYLFRTNKNDNYAGGCNGGGSSYAASGQTAPRLAYKSVHFFQSVECLAPTLMHEVAHNLGLSHYSSANTDAIDVSNPYLNLMKTGRDEQNVFAFQWAIIHQTIERLKREGSLNKKAPLGASIF